jgi:hypothetical protein
MGSPQVTITVCYPFELSVLFGQVMGSIGSNNSSADQDHYPVELVFVYTLTGMVKSEDSGSVLASASFPKFHCCSIRH